MSSTTTNHHMDNSDLIAIADKTVDQAFDFWTYYKNRFYVEQPDTAKHHIWLAATVITALFALKGEWLMQAECAFTLAKICFYTSFILACTGIVLGVSCLSSSWFYGKGDVEPVDKMKALIDDAKFFGSKSDERLEDLEHFCEYLDNAINGLKANINNRGIRLRWLSFMVAAAIALATISAIIVI